jgi:peroxiredoxin
MIEELPDHLAEKAAIMREFTRLRAAGEPVSDELRARHVNATNDGYASGPEEGEPVPAFQLPDQSGTPRTLADLTGANGLLLVFHRSADWCRYCRSQLLELEHSRAMLEKNGIRIAAVSYDAVEKLTAFARKKGIGFPLLSDEGSATIRRFGILNANFAPGLRSHGAAHPVTYLVAPDGIVVRKYFVPNYLHRVSGSAVALREFGAGAANAATVTLHSGALTVQIGLSGEKAFPGQEVGFFAKFELEAGWHLYGSPLPEEYTTTSIAFDDPRIERQSFELPLAGFRKIAPDEELPLLSGSFDALGSLLLKFECEPGRIALPGRLTFQQCSDTVCEAPQSISFELPLTIEPLVTADRKE